MLLSVNATIRAEYAKRDVAGALCEAMLIIGNAAGSPGQLSMVLEWVLGPLKSRWASQAMQQTYCDPAAFLAAYIGVTPIVKLSNMSSAQVIQSLKSS